ncbi:unnamed protein product [Coregonus sp. 'balchen']|nr:unnamed protein product [Coregonus sp. 'balchen']
MIQKADEGAAPSQIHLILWVQNNLRGLWGEEREKQSINWTKNGLEVTEGAYLSRYYPNKDGTFHQFSTLSFTPQEGDVYACTVEHTALKDPKTRFWEPEVSEVSGSSAGPAVFCGVGLTLGLLGSTIYPRDEEELGVENTLIYSVNHFFPPSVKVNWTNNSLEVTEGASLSWCNLIKDRTFYQFSTLSFTPLEGDFYACTVAHTARRTPKLGSGVWPEVSEVSASSAGPAVFCRVGLALGLLGVATGTFLIIKGNQCN